MAAAHALNRVPLPAHQQGGTLSVLRIGGPQLARLRYRRDKASFVEDTDEVDAPTDGRQSERALAIRRGVCRRLRAEGFALIAEVTLKSGRRADLVALSPRGDIWIIEIKSSIQDFKSDQKWPDYMAFADKFFFATSTEVGPDIFPEEAGLIIADAFGAEILWDTDRVPLSAARRKELLIRIARAGAHRLHDLEDPEAAETNR